MSLVVVDLLHHKQERRKCNHSPFAPFWPKYWISGIIRLKTDRAVGIRFTFLTFRCLASIRDRRDVQVYKSIILVLWHRKFFNICSFYHLDKIAVWFVPELALEDSSFIL